MIITIDGTSASGKTSVARELAHRLGFALLRTGAMYRVFALAAHRAGFCAKASPEQLASHLSQWHIDADDEHAWLNGEDVSAYIDGNLMSHLSSTWAELQIVREHVTKFIRQRADHYLSQHQSFVAEGRDQGSYVFKDDADCKFYIDAAVEIRAARRLKDLHHREDWSKTQEQLVAELNERDERDRTRKFAPLCIPEGAVQINSSHLTKEEVVDVLYQAVQVCRENRG